MKVKKMYYVRDQLQNPMSSLKKGHTVIRIKGVSVTHFDLPVEVEVFPDSIVEVIYIFLVFNIFPRFTVPSFFRLILALICFATNFPLLYPKLALLVTTILKFDICLLYILFLNFTQLGCDRSNGYFNGGIIQQCF